MQQKFNKKQISEQQQEQQAEQATAAEFASAEELLRYDAAQCAPPADVARRLQESLAKEKTKPWWRRWFSSGDDI